MGTVRSATMTPWRTLPQPGSVTTTQAAQVLGLSRVQVRVLIHEDVLQRTGYGPILGGGQEGLVSVSSLDRVLHEIQSGDRKIRPNARKGKP